METGSTYNIFKNIHQLNKGGVLIINEFIIENGILIILIQSKKYGTFEVLADLKDYDKLMKYKWGIVKDNNTFYALTRINKKQVKMHRHIFDITDNTIIDHRNRNGLDNRRKNLKLSNTKLNGKNRGISKNNKTGFNGVRKYKNSYMATWTDNKGIQCSKSFSIRKYGNDIALEKAKRYRYLKGLKNNYSFTSNDVDNINYVLKVKIKKIL